MLNKELFFERLGITAGPWPIHVGPWKMQVGRSDQVVCEIDVYKDNKKQNARLIHVAPDMLIALVESTIELERTLEDIGGCDHEINICCCDLVAKIENNLNAIEQATGRKWSKVKEIYEECMG